MRRRALERWLRRAWLCELDREGSHHSRFINRGLTLSPDVVAACAATSLTASIPPAEPGARLFDAPSRVVAQVSQRVVVGTTAVSSPRARQSPRSNQGGTIIGAGIFVATGVAYSPVLRRSCRPPNARRRVGQHSPRLRRGNNVNQ